MEIPIHIINIEDESAGVFLLKKRDDGSYYWDWDYDYSVRESNGEIFKELRLDIEITVYVVDFEEWHLEDNPNGNLQKD